MKLGKGGWELSWTVTTVVEGEGFRFCLTQFRADYRKKKKKLHPAICCQPGLHAYYYIIRLSHCSAEEP